MILHGGLHSQALWGPEGPQGAKSTGSSASKDELQRPSCHQRLRLGSCRGSIGARSRYFDLRPPCRGEGRTLPEAGVANRGGLGLGPVPGARDPRGNWTLRAAAEAGPCWGLAGGRSHCQRVRGPRGNWEGPRFPALASWVGPAGALERPWGELAREGSSPAEAGSRWPGPARPPRPL